MAYTITVIICQLSLKSYIQFFLKARKKKKTIHKNLYKKNSNGKEAYQNYMYS